MTHVLLGFLYFAVACISGARQFSLPQIQILTQKHVPKSYTEAQLKHILTFIYHGGYAIVREWINAETRETPEEISELFLMLVSNIFTFDQILKIK